MNDKRENILFPVGRLIQGSLYEPNTKNMSGEPLVVKNSKSPNFGKPRVDYYIGVAIPKTPGVTNWSQEVSQNPKIGAWGKKIWDAGCAFWGELVNQKSTFSWKIVDGDSPDFDRSTPPKRICDKPHHKGHWIIHMGRGSVPRIVNNDGSAYLLDKNIVRTGFYIQVAATLSSNFSDLNPGIYINHDVVSFQYPGEEIKQGIDPATIGFGDGTPPVKNVMPPTPSPAMQMQPPAAVPNYKFVDQAGLPPPAPPAPTVPVAPKLLKNGQSYDIFIAAGWTDAQLVANGYL